MATWEDVFGVTIEQARDSIGKGGKGEWEHFTPEFVGTQVQSLNEKALMQAIKASQKAFQDSRISQPEARVNIDTTMPVSIFFVGDVHAGSIYTDHRRFLRELETIVETPGCYVAFMSNMIDNAIPSQYPSNMLANAIPPDKQAVWLRAIIERANRSGKVLGAVTSPCHEGWTYKHTGQDINALIYGFEERKFPVLENGGIITVKIGNQIYKVALYHQVAPFESNFNETHALRQKNRLDLMMEGDVVVGAHKHFASAHTVFEGRGNKRKVVAYIRSGTYKGIGKINDQWAVGMWGSSGEPSAQSVMLWPGKRKIEAFLEFQTAIDMHIAASLRELVK